jgi:hypothetical protein
MDLRDNFKSKCPVRYNSDGTHWYCKRQLSEKQEIENKTCNYTRCPGRELTEEEETERLLQIESKMKDTKKQIRKDPMDALIRRMKKELEKLEAEELNFKKVDDNNKEFCKKNMENDKECYRDGFPSRTPIYEEVKEIKDIEKPIVIEEQVQPVLKKCEWHICPNYFEVGKKEKFCCERCRRKDNRLKSRRRCALRKKEISAKGL